MDISSHNRVIYSRPSDAEMKSFRWIKDAIEQIKLEEARAYGKDSLIIDLEDDIDYRRQCNCRIIHEIELFRPFAEMMGLGVNLMTPDRNAKKPYKFLFGAWYQDENIELPRGDVYMQPGFIYNRSRKTTMLLRNVHRIVLDPFDNALFYQTPSTYNGVGTDIISHNPSKLFDVYDEVAKYDHFRFRNYRMYTDSPYFPVSKKVLKLLTLCETCR